MKRQPVSSKVVICSASGVIPILVAAELIRGSLHILPPNLGTALCERIDELLQRKSRKAN